MPLKLFLIVVSIITVQKLFAIADDFGYELHDGYDTVSAIDSADAEIVETGEAVFKSKNIQTPNFENIYVDMKKPFLIPDEELAFDKLYIAGVRAYDDQLWYSCATKIERAIKGYNKYKTIMSECRLNCTKDIRASKFSDFTTTVPELIVFSKFLKSAECIRRCKRESLTIPVKISDEMENAFQKRKPYMFLQFCYYKLDRLSQAASAAYTYYLASPDDADVKDNIVFYRDKARVPEEEFVDLELLPYKEFYIRGLNAYKNEHWKDLIQYMELCLEDYWKQDEKCHSDCQAESKATGNEFSTVIGDLIVDILNCRLQCQQKLSIVYTEPIPYFLRDLFHYLQFGYFKESEFEKSLELAETFLLFTPSHEVMKRNKEKILSELHLTESKFNPRKDGLEYIKRTKDLSDLMDFIVKNYLWTDSLDETPVEEELEQTSAIDSERSQERSAENHDDWLTRFEKLGMHIIAKAADLKREGRFVTDGLLKEEQCEDTLQLIKESLKLPFGAEEFNFKLSQQKLLENTSEEFEALLRQLIRVIEVVRHYVHVYRGPEVVLFIKKTSIICWQVPEESTLISDCYPQEDGSCIQYQDFSDSLFEDQYTTVTYLNNVDEDGDFHFLNEDIDVDSSFGVKCGRTVGFNTGDRHRVKVPKKGTQRCALVVKYTTNMDDEEKDLNDLLLLLHKADELRFNQTKKNSAEVLKHFYDKGVKIAKTPEDLKGAERFVADGFATEEQCETLRNVAMELGKAGDGYYGRQSPHTVNEYFAGLNLIAFRKSLSLLGDGYGHYTSKPSFISPHTEHELYQGITVFRANKLMHDGYVPLHGLKMYLELSENSRLFVEKYFNLSKPLYFEYTHLVCRTAKNDSNLDREDLSHPIHGDNCNLQPNGSCTKDFPAYIQRDYSALLYLNSDFNGGEFFFAHPNKTEQVSLRPKCGRLVGFNAGQLHGVKAVKSGQRCALAMWYTMSSRFKELAHIQARKTLELLEAKETKHEEL